LKFCATVPLSSDAVKHRLAAHTIYRQGKNNFLCCHLNHLSMQHTIYWYMIKMWSYMKRLFLEIEYNTSASQGTSRAESFSRKFETWQRQTLTYSKVFKITWPNTVTGNCSAGTGGKHKDKTKVRASFRQGLPSVQQIKVPGSGS